MISIIIPTYNERKNIRRVIHDIQRTLTGIDHEIIVVDDDSPDGTEAEVIEAQLTAPVRLVKRVGERGLGSAVVRGLKEAKGGVLAVMDADGSHPAEALIRMAEKIDSGSDIVVASRYVFGGHVENWTSFRKLVSRVASLLAYGLTPIADPMSGYFMLRRNVIEGVELNPTGYKIGLEVLVKGKQKKLDEIPYTFRNRRWGESKLGPSEYINYLKHLVKLYLYKIKSYMP